MCIRDRLYFCEEHLTWRIVGSFDPTEEFHILRGVSASVVDLLSILKIEKAGILKIERSKIGLSVNRQSIRTYTSDLLVASRAF